MHTLPGRAVIYSKALLGLLTLVKATALFS